MADNSFLQDVLQYIQQDWEFMTSDDCVPVQIALQLMDTSTLGRADRYGDFQQTHQQLQKALKAIVNGIVPSSQHGDCGLMFGRTPSGVQQFHRNLS